MSPSLAIQVTTYLIEDLAPNLLEEGWEVITTTKALRRLGQCRHDTKQIVLSEQHLYINSPDFVERLAKHEIAHAVVGKGIGHGPIWQMQAVKFGIEPTACDNEANMPAMKFKTVCPTCGKVYERQQRPRRGANYWCRVCRTSLFFFMNPEYSE